MRKFHRWELLSQGMINMHSWRVENDEKFMRTLTAMMSVASRKWKLSWLFLAPKHIAHAN